MDERAHDLVTPRERDSKDASPSVPSARTVSNWLKQFTQTTLQPLVDLNHTLVMEAVERLGLARLMGLAAQLSERSALLEAEAGVSEPRLPFKH